MDFHKNSVVFAQRIIRTSAIALLLLVISIAGVLRAQSDASISGSVSDPSGGAVPGAAVSIRNVETGAGRTLSTDEAGRFNAPLLPVGTYEIKVEKPGFLAQTKTGLELAGLQQQLSNRGRLGTRAKARAHLHFAARRDPPD